MCFAYACEHEDAVVAGCRMCMQFICASASRHLKRTHKHTYTLTEVSYPLEDNMPYECLSGRELECVARESAGISPLAAQQTAAKAWPSTESGSAQNTHACTRAHTQHLFECSHSVTLWVLKRNKKKARERENARVRVSVCDGLWCYICFSDVDAVGVFCGR